MVNSFSSTLDNKQNCKARVKNATKMLEYFFVFSNYFLMYLKHEFKYARLIGRNFNNIVFPMVNELDC